MASQTVFTCTHCEFTVSSWDDGNPYIEGPDGERHHFYHPGEDNQIRKIVQDILGHFPSESEVQEMLQKHSGNESDSICLACGAKTMRDYRRDKRSCPECGSTKLRVTHNLAGQPCPSCRSGCFDQGRPGAIS